MERPQRKITYQHTLMKRLKQRWGDKYPDKNNILKQNLRDNAARFKQQMGWKKNLIQKERFNLEK